MIKRDGEHYMRAARMIAESDDPREEILRIAQLASHAGRMKRRVLAGGSVLGVLVAGVLAWQLLGAAPTSGEHPGETPPAVETADEDAAWVTGLFTTAENEPLTPSDDQRLRRYMQKPSATVEKRIVDWTMKLHKRPAAGGLSGAESDRLVALLYGRSNEAARWALNVLIRANADIPEERLVWFLSNPEAVLIKAAMSATFLHCSRTGSFVSPESIETFVYGEDRALQKTAILALSSLKKYVPPDRLMDFLESGDREIRQVARDLLRRKGQ